MKANVKTRRLSKDIAYAELKQRIINGELEPGKIIQEESLAEVLGVSRTPLREAIQRLEIEDFLVRQANGRLKVVSVSLMEVEEIFIARSMIEGYIARHAASSASAEDVKKLTVILEKIKQSFLLGFNHDFVTYGFEFHDYLAKISGLYTFAKMLDHLHDHSLRYCRFVSLHGDWNIKADEEHSLILQQIAEGNKEGAEEAMRDHILSSLSTARKKIYELEINRKE
ncbi:GntR family transcriptional regulator [Bacillaceae bacterium Marseille-Q3522]|nr:GntR family transcriptional regulator [Bacillaceae bacterium Marseille-Q3522]